MKHRIPRKLITKVPHKSRFAVILTPKAINLLNQMAKQTGLSKSQLVEDFASKSLASTHQTAAIKESTQDRVTESKVLPITTPQKTLGDSSNVGNTEQSQQQLIADLRSQIEALRTSEKEKDTLIEELQGKVASLQRSATIGEWQLNKWRRS